MSTDNGTRAGDADGPETLLTYDEGSVRHIRFNRPARLNALTPMQHTRVIAAIENAEKDQAVRVVALSGAGRAFCAGDDISGRERVWPAAYQDRLVDLDIGVGPLILQEVTATIRRCSKPTVALMQGYAIGAGYDYATSCDFRIAAEDCQFGDPRVHRALWAAEGWSYKLPRLAGAGRAAKIGLLGELLTSSEAFEYGLVHRIVPAGTSVLDGSKEFLGRLAGIPADSLSSLKSRLLASQDLPARAFGL